MTQHEEWASLMGQMQTLRSKGRYKEGIIKGEAALKLAVRLPNEMELAVTLGGLASLCEFQGLYEKAEPLYLRSLAIKEKSLGADHPDVAVTLNNLAGLYRSQGLYEKALDIFVTSLQRQYKFLANRLAYIKEQDHQLYLKEIKFTLELLLSLVYNYLSQQPTAIQTALNSLLLTKALSATAIATRNAILHSDRYPHLKPLLAQIQQLTEQKNTLDYSDPHLPQILSQIDQIQRQINQQTSEISLPEPAMVDRRAIALQLPNNSTLIEFIKFDLLDKDQNWSDTRYLAFILPQTNSNQVQMIDLGAAGAIDNLIEKCYSAITQDFPNIDSAVSTKRSSDTISTEPQQLSPLPLQPQNSQLSALHQQIIAPLIPYLHSDHLIMAPDGALFRLPFNLLFPEQLVTYLTTGRDLIRTTSNKPAGRSLIVAHPDFDHTAPQLSILPNSQLAAAGIRDLQSFDPLPNFGTLGKAITHQINAQYHEQQAATKSIVVNSNCPHILSILTHGFALETNPDQDPMANTGLAFSGAKHSTQNLLLANEIATLNLHSNNLTILVACQTALGHIQPSEGIYGLRRAFAIAGTKTLIATLWQIPVLASIILIERFFENLQQRSMGKGTALTEAQTYLRTRTIADLAGSDALADLANIYDLTGVDCPFAHPYFWAAWICQGQTTPMDYVGTRAIGEFKIGGKIVNLQLKQ